MTRESIGRVNQRPTRLYEGPLDYEPVNELGVVFLFSYLARRRWGLRVETIRAGFPDCIAYKGGEKVRIEFEYRSSSFRTHLHEARRCDWIVCWIHDWPGVPDRLQVKELRREFGLGFNVWFQPVREYSEIIGRYNRAEWSVASQASPGDLVLFYRTLPHALIEDVFVITGPVRHLKANWKPGMDYQASIRRVCKLEAPLHLADLKQHRILGNAGFVRGQMQGRRRASAYWSEIHRMILDRNPSLRRVFARYGPERLD